MDELIKRLEGAGPDRLLDRDIWKAMGGKIELVQWAPGHHFERWTDWNGVLYPRADESHWTMFTSSVDAARSLLPWKDHPGATLTSKTIQSGLGEFYHFVEFTWPSTERQGRARTEAIATCICALEAICETEHQLAPYRDKPAPRAADTASMCGK